MPPPRPSHAYAQLFKWRRRFWLVVAVVALFAGDMAMRAFGPPEWLTAMVRGLTAGDTPTIATGASFSVSATPNLLFTIGKARMRLSFPPEA